jgi:hypothetical protein
MLTNLGEGLHTRSELQFPSSFQRSDVSHTLEGPFVQLDALAVLCLDAINSDQFPMYHMSFNNVLDNQGHEVRIQPMPLGIFIGKMNKALSMAQDPHVCTRIGNAIAFFISTCRDSLSYMFVSGMSFDPCDSY